MSSVKFTSAENRVFVKTDDGWKREHVVVWERFNGPLHEGCCIHHLDGNPTNNDINNLDMMTLQRHTSIHQGNMLIGGVWLHECPYCHELLFLKDLSEHVSAHLRKYIGEFVSYKMLNQSLGIGKWTINTKIRYNTETDHLAVEQYLSPPTHYVASLFNCTPEYGITLHIDYVVVGTKTSILTGWRDRKPKTRGERALMYSKKRLGKTKWDTVR
jgi:hypothetical protein